MNSENLKAYNCNRFRSTTGPIPAVRDLIRPIPFSISQSLRHISTHVCFWHFSVNFSLKKVPNQILCQIYLLTCSLSWICFIKLITAWESILGIPRLISWLAKGSKTALDPNISWTSSKKYSLTGKTRPLISSVGQL